jgi:type I restriction enzyme M protein
MNKLVTEKTKQLVDDLKSICANHGLGNDGNEYKIITEVFLYKFINDKFFYEVRQLDGQYSGAKNLEEFLKNLADNKYELLLAKLNANVAKLKKEHFLSNLYNNQNKEQYAIYFDDTMRAIATFNAAIFSVGTSGGEKIRLFSGISNYVAEEAKRDGFCRSIINKLFECNFGEIFHEKYDFFATIFEYLIKDYNKDGGGKYAEYYTPHAVARIMSEILVTGKVSNALCYDPSAGTGSLLMSLAHQIGEDRCTIYSQDISQKSSTLLRMNLILNTLVHSLPNVVQGNTLTEPYHMKKGMSFDYIVSNPPFKLDFSDWRDSIDASKQSAIEDENEEIKKLNKRFFAGVPKVPNKDKDKMSIYLLFIQHIISSLKVKGKAAVVVPTGFITAQGGIEYKIREHLIEKKWLKGVVSMPSNIFATTGTNVSVLFIDKSNKDDVILVDASKLGEKIKDGKNQKTLLSSAEEEKIISSFVNKKQINDFSVVLTYDKIKAKNYSFAAGQYFDIKIRYSKITPKEFQKKMADYNSTLSEYFKQGKKLESEILKNLGNLKLEKV